MKRTVVTIKTGRSAFLTNRLMQAGVVLDKIEKGTGTFRFCVSFGDLPRVEKVLREQDVPYELSGSQGVKRECLRVLKRPFLLISALISLAALFFFESFIYGYSVRGNVNVNTQSVVGILQAHHVDGFTYKGSLDLKEIKREVVALDGVSFASVKVVGNRLFVEIKEELPKELPEQDASFSICASHSAVVTKVVAESGTPVVKAGDSVQAGDVLIKAAYVFTEGETPAPARGEVWGRVTYQKQVILPAFTIDTLATGEVFRVRTLTLFGRTVGKEQSPPFDRYEKEERVLLRAAGAIVTEITYRRLAEQRIYHDFDSEAPAVLNKALSELFLEVPFLAHEQGTARAEQKKLDNVLYTVIYYSVEQRIDSLPNAR